MNSSLTDWQVGLESVSSRLGKVLQMGLYTDCVFSLGTDSNVETFEAHRLILSVASPVFEAMFFGSMANKLTPIPIIDVQPNAFKLMLRYIYTDEAHLTSFTEVCELCYAAKKYMIPTLVEQCTQFIWKDLHPGNVCQAFEFAKLFEESQIIVKCINIILEKTEEILKLPNFSEVGIATLEFILSQEKLQISEIDLWKACVLWSTDKCKCDSVEVNATNQRRALQEVLHLIRFLAMTPNQFANGPATTNILTVDESLQILLSLSSGINSA